MSHHQVQSILLYFGQIFLLCKIFGIYPQDLKAFQRDHTLQKNKLGTIIVYISMIIIIVCYNLLIYSFSEEDKALKASQSTLTFVIGLFLTYIGLVMMVTDQITAIRNQDKIDSELYQRLMAVDERLYKENVIIDHYSIQFHIRAMIFITVICELTILIATYVLLVDYKQWISILWLFSSVPTFYNSLDKIWFAVTLHALRQRFHAINGALEDMVESHIKFKLWISDVGEPNTEIDMPAIMGNQYDHNLEYLYNELNNLDVGSLKNSAKNKIAPILRGMNSFGEDIGATPKKHHKNSKPYINMAFESELTNLSKVEEKLNNLCQLHDEICEIGKTLNELWSYPILILMAYGFLIFTAQLYFLYCATQNQAIPSLFRSAKNAIITTISLGYTSGKCVYLIYLSWKTALVSKRTGICLHKCGVVADNNLLYEIINHLSLKLLNHSVDFSACGFFTLDMETLYGVSGGITSYLIILIQFNLAAQQAKEAIHTFTNFNETAHLIAGLEEANITNMFDNITTTIMTSLTDY